MAENVAYSPQSGQMSSIHSDQQWSLTVPPDLENLPDSEKTLLIRARKRQNSETVRKFFGSDLKIDISLSAIEKYRLPAMLESDLPLAYFICFLLKYHGIENLFFLQAVRRFCEKEFASPQRRIQEARGIYDNFIEDDKPMQVNTTAAIKTRLRSNLTTAPKALFSEAVCEAYGLLMQLYERFLGSEYYPMMKDGLQANEFPHSYRAESDCDGQRTTAYYCGSIYPVKAYQSAVAQLHAALKHAQGKYDEGFLSRRESKVRGLQISRMLQSFLNERLLAEFDDVKRVSMMSQVSAVSDGTME